MGKLLFWIILIIVALLAARILARQSSKPAPAQRARVAPSSTPKTVQGEQMVRCGHCGIHLPRSEAVLMHGQTWCSTEHAKLGVSQQK